MAKVGDNNENNYIASAVAWIKSQTKSFLSKVSKVTNYLKELFKAKISSFNGWLKNTVNGFKGWCTNKVNDFKGWYTNKASDSNSSLESKFVNDFKGRCTNKVNDLKGWYTNKASDSNSSLESKFEDSTGKIEALVKFLKDMVNSISTLKRFEELSSPLSFLLQLLVDNLGELIICCIESKFQNSEYEELTLLIEEGKFIILRLYNENWKGPLKTLADDLIKNPRVIFENLKTFFNTI